MSSARQGLLYGLGAFGLWGLSPLYWRLLAHVPADEIILHRVVWSAVFLALALRGRWGTLRSALGTRGTAAVLLATALLIGVNWYVYIWAIQEHRVLDASLAYYITPLFSVALGTLVLGERMHRLQAAAFLAAAGGVGVLVLSHGRLPLLALVMASTFALYGLLRKRVSVDALTGLAAETFLLAAPCLALLLARNSFHDWRTSLLLAGGAGATALPLLFFIEAARRLELKTIGFLQFLSPTIQFLLAVLLFGEPLPRARLAAFALIWAAVALYCADAALRRPAVSAIPAE